MSDEVSAFLLRQLNGHGVARVRICAELGQQTLRAELEGVYAARHGVQGFEPGDRFDFVHGPPHWGALALKLHDRAIVFLRNLSGRLYESAWRGHLLLEDIDGVPYAVYQHKELWLSPTLPQSLRCAAVQDPKRGQSSAIRLTELEAYLRKLIDAEPQPGLPLAAGTGAGAGTTGAVAS